MAGARAQLDSGQLVLVAPSWRCSDRPYVCTITVAGDELVARVSALGDDPFTCSASFRGQPIQCTAQLWYAPRLKPYLELGHLEGVSLRAAILERPWRVLDQGLLGESGPLHFHTGCLFAFLLAIGAAALIRLGGLWWLLRIAVAAITFAALNVAWFLSCFVLGYID
ncbi:MAG: hypothetical protein ABW352_23170 [Polyangiales bacterium]